MRTAGLGPAAPQTLAAPDDDELVSLYRASQLTGVDVAVLYRWVEKDRLVPRERRQRGSRTVVMTTVADVEAARVAPAKTRAAAVARYRAGDVSYEDVGEEFGASGAAVLKWDRATEGWQPRDNVQAAMASRERRLEREKQERGGRLDADEIAALVPCAPVTATRHARTGHLGPYVERASDGTWLFRAQAVERLREVIAEGERRNREAVEEARRAGRFRRPRTGETRECAWCGESYYVPPSLFRVLHDSHRCWGKRRWWKLGAVPEALVERMGGNARRRWKLRWVDRPGRRRNDQRHDWQETLEIVRALNAETHPPERELVAELAKRGVKVSRRTVRIALGRPV